MSTKFAAVTGSSPRMRGTRLVPLGFSGGGGIIPAYAGNTMITLSGKSSNGDHPRVCGEHQKPTPATITVKGSSPRMRGTLSAAREVGVEAGIIPAYAGNTTCRKWRNTWMRDHPRVCGEHQSQIGAHLRTLGIIPAYAGNTLAVLRYHIRHWDHPRVCGEHPLLATPKHVRQGSSPRMRGTLGLSVSCRVLRGIIPAYAGNTARSCRA